MIGMEGEERMEFSIMLSSQWLIIKNPLIFIKTSEEIVIEWVIGLETEVLIATLELDTFPLNN